MEKERIGKCVLSFQKSYEAVDVYKSLYKLLSKKEMDTDCLTMAMFATGSEHGCVSEDNFCNNVSLSFYCLENSCKPNVAELADLLAEVDIKSTAEVSIEFTKEFKIEDFLKSRKIISGD